MGRARLARRRLSVCNCAVWNCPDWPYAEVANLRLHSGLVGIRYLRDYPH